MSEDPRVIAMQAAAFQALIARWPTDSLLTPTEEDQRGIRKVAQAAEIVGFLAINGVPWSMCTNAISGAHS